MRRKTKPSLPNSDLPSVRKKEEKEELNVVFGGATSLLGFQGRRVEIYYYCLTF